MIYIPEQRHLIVLCMVLLLLLLLDVLYMYDCCCGVFVCCGVRVCNDDDVGHDVISVLTAILQLFPLDQYVARPAMIMQRTAEDEARAFNVEIWREMKATIEKIDKNYPTVELEQIERFAFYERAKKAYAVVATGEARQYANIIIKKGVVRVEE